MPGIQDCRFDRSVILICSHSKDGSMGFVLNHPVEKSAFRSILQELKSYVDPIIKQKDIQIFRGGPVEQGRAFVLHSLDYSSINTATVGSICGVTCTLDALKWLTNKKSHARSFLAFGYAAWSSGQLEREITENYWLTVEATSILVFDTPYSNRYNKALGMLGVREATLSSIIGHA